MDMTAPVGTTPLDATPNVLLGKPLDRVDGPPKVTGTATYAYEYREPDGIAYGYLVPSTIAKGRIASLDTGVAERMPGVVSIVTYRNAPKQGKKSQQVSPELAGDAIDHYGQAVAVVVAETFEQARAAAAAVVVGYAPDPITVDLASAKDKAFVPKARGDSKPDSATGDAEAAFAAAPVKLDVTYTTPAQTHAMMEPHATLAYWRRANLILFTANQMPNRGQDILASVLAIPQGQHPSRQPLCRGWFRCQADAATGRDPGGARLQGRRPSGQAGPHAPAGLSFDDPSIGHDPADPARGGLRWTSAGRGPSSVVGKYARRRDLRVGRRGDAFPLRDAKPQDRASAVGPRPSCRFRDAGSGRGGRHAGDRMRDGRTRRNAEARSRGAPDPQRADRGSDPSRPVFDASTGPLLEGGCAAFRLGEAEPDAGTGARRSVAGGARRCGGEPRQSPAAGPGRTADRA